MTTTGTRRRAGLVTVLVWVVLLAVVLGAVVIGTVLYRLDRASTPPDVAAVARSAAVQDAGRRAAALLDDRVATVVDAAAGESPAPAAVADVCLSEPGSFIGQGYGPVTCTRTITRILAFDGDLPARTTQWDRALRAAGWAGSRGLDQPVPPDAWAGTASYRDGAGVSLEIGWGERGYPPSFHGPPLVVRLADNEVYRTHRPIDGDAAIRAAFRRSRYVAVATVSFTYHGISTGQPG
jgi:hypothetical protein